MTIDCNKHILITGGAGFIGSHTADYLLKQGLKVTVLDNLSSGRLVNLNLAHPQLTFIEGDINDATLIKKLMLTVDAVIHLAAIASVPLSLTEPLTSNYVNAQGFLHILHAIYQAQKPIRLIYASSAAIYGEMNGQPCSDESTFLQLPMSPYGLEKYQNEQYANLYYRLYGIKSLGLRYFNVYGARQLPDSPYAGVISRFLAAYYRDQVLTIFGDGSQARDFVYIDDIVRANILSLQSDCHDVINIATGEPQNLKQLIHCIEQTGTKSAHIHYREKRLGDINLSVARVEKAQKVLQFKAQISLSEGIKRLGEIVYDKK
jgi:UDP-glucose 4-epimerase